MCLNVVIVCRRRYKIEGHLFNRNKQASEDMQQQHVDSACSGQATCNVSVGAPSPTKRTAVQRYAQHTQTLQTAGDVDQTMFFSRALYIIDQN